MKRVLGVAIAATIVIGVGLAAVFAQPDVEEPVVAETTAPPSTERRVEVFNEPDFAPPGGLVSAMLDAEDATPTVEDAAYLDGERAFTDAIAKLEELEHITPDVDTLFVEAQTALDSMGLKYTDASDRSVYLTLRAELAMQQRDLGNKRVADLGQHGGDYWPDYPGIKGADAPPSLYLPVP